MTNPEHKLLLKGVAGGTLIGMVIGLMLALVIALKPQFFAGLSRYL
jgi:hypothetical protein